MIGATAAFLVAAPHLPLANGIGVFLSLAATLWAMGALLDGRVSICEALYVFAAASTCAAYALDWPVVQDVMKPLAMALLILAFALRKGLLDVKRLVLAALAASLIGDTLLLRPSLFLPGLVAFLAAHCFYVAAFSRGVGFLPSRVALGGIAAFAALVLAYVWPGVSAGPEGAGRGLCRRNFAHGRAGDWPGDRAWRRRRVCGRGRRVHLHAVRPHDCTRQIRQCRLAGRSVDAADLLSCARADRVLCAAPRVLAPYAPNQRTAMLICVPPPAPLSEA